MSQYRSPRQSKRLHAALAAAKLMHQKEDLVSSFTNGRTSQSSYMHPSECEALTEYLNSFNGQPGAEQYNSSANKMRRKILSICHEMQWEDEHGKIDWSRLEAYLTKYGYLHKSNLNDYAEEELPTLVTQFENLLKSFYAKG